MPSINHHILSYILCLLGIMALGSSLSAQDLYIVRDPSGTITLTSRNPASINPGSRARYRTIKDRSRRRRTSALKPIHSSYSQYVDAVSKRFSLEPALINAVIHVESAFKARARSHKGAMGLMQLMPGTAKDLGVQDPFHPLENIWGGVSYLSKMLDTFDGDIKLALAAYNAGPGAVKRYNNNIPPYRETQNYVTKVLTAREVYRCVAAGKSNCAKY